MSAGEKIKRFFAKKKEEAKFKLSLGGHGQGRKLNSPESSTSTTQQKRKVKDAYNPPKRKELSEEARAAAAAAMARIEKKDTKEFNTSLAAIKAQVKRELEAERKLKEELEKAESREATEIENKNKKLACQGVFFRCPLISNEILSKKEWKVKIKEFLYEQLAEERGLTACLIIQNCNTKEKAQACVETLTKYLENIINHPEEEKYQKIRMSNRIFCDKVKFAEGAIEFLNAAGFCEQEVDGEIYLVWSSSNMHEDTDLQVLLDALHCSEPISLELDRNIQVLLPSQARKVELPQEFFRMTPEEIKREQQLRTEAIENAQLLRTKAMRDREEQRILNKYRFALIRVKFPDSIYLQGTFNVYEKLSDVYEFVQSCLCDESIEFGLNAPAGLKFSDEDMDKSLYDLKLIPNTVLTFTCETNPQGDGHYLKEELLMLIQSM